jgi:hypothetical protein
LNQAAICPDLHVRAILDLGDEPAAPRAMVATSGTVFRVNGVPPRRTAAVAFHLADLVDP